MDSMSNNDEKEMEINLNDFFQSINKYCNSDLKEPDLSFLERIAKYGNENYQYQQINLDLLTQNDISQLRLSIDQVTRMPVDVQKSMGSISMWINLGSIFHKLKMKGLEKICYHVALLHNPDSTISLSHIASTIYEMEEKNKIYQRIIELDPNDSMALVDYSTTLDWLRDENKREIVRCLRKAILIDDKNSIAWFHLGNWCKQYEEKEQCHRETVKLEPDNPFYWYNLAEFLKFYDRKATDKAESEECFEKARELGWGEIRATVMKETRESASDTRFLDKLRISKHPELRYYFTDNLMMGIEYNNRFIEKCLDLTATRPIPKQVQPRPPSEVTETMVGNATDMVNSIKWMAHRMFKEYWHHYGMDDVNFLLERIKCEEKRGDFREKARVLLTLGRNYLESRKFGNAFKAFQDALEVNTNLNNREGIASSLLSIAYYYDESDQLDRAIQKFTEVLPMYRELNNLHLVGVILGYLGILYWKQIQYNKAHQCWSESLQIAQQLEEKEGIDLYTDALNMCMHRENWICKKCGYSNAYQSKNCFQCYGDRGV